MTIFPEMAKYDYLQYDYFFKKIVIFRLKNMTNTKTYAPPPPRVLPMLARKKKAKKSQEKLAKFLGEY